MKRYYSKTTQTTYVSGIHAAMPNDAVEITDQRYEEVIVNPAAGKVRSHDEKGLPILVDPLPLTVEELSAQERFWRDTEIERVKWLRERHRDQLEIGAQTTLTPEQFGELLVYVQSLRDWPQAPEFPAEESRPAAPEWIAAQVP
ncbi:tail fiber assembly protein [Pseudomonas sp. RT4P38]